MSALELIIFLYEHDCYHSDIKPDNIVITGETIKGDTLGNFYLKFIDFGVMT